MEPATIDHLLAYTDHTTTNTYYMITDHLGTVHAVVNSSGSVIESYKYDAFGRVLGIYDSNNSPISESAIGNHYLHQGRWYSWKTGLYFHRARWRDPVTSRWLSKDPIGISGGLNQYVFADNNPVNRRDPLGLWEHDDLPGLQNAVEDMMQDFRDAYAPRECTGNNRPPSGPIILWWTNDYSREGYLGSWYNSAANTPATDGGGSTLVPIDLGINKQLRTMVPMTNTQVLTPIPFYRMTNVTIYPHVNITNMPLLKHNTVFHGWEELRAITNR